MSQLHGVRSICGQVLQENKQLAIVHDHHLATLILAITVLLFIGVT